MKYAGSVETYGHLALRMSEEYANFWNTTENQNLQAERHRRAVHVAHHVIAFIWTAYSMLSRWAT